MGNLHNQSNSRMTIVLILNNFLELLDHRLCVEQLITYAVFIDKF